MEPKTALYLVPPHARMIARGEKTLIVKTVEFKQHIGEPLYLIEDSQCWGIIVLKPPMKISYEDFLTLRSQHRITDEEFKKWKWDKDSLYAYRFDVIESYKYPREVKLPQGVQEFVSVDKIEFLSEVHLAGLSEEELKLRHRLAHITRDRKEHNLIVEELKRRGIEHLKIDEIDEIQIEDLEQIDDKFCRSLSDKELIDLDLRLHELYKKLGKVTEPLHNAHVFVWNELRLRNIPHPGPQDKLYEETFLEVEEYPEPKLSSDEITLEEVLKAFPEEIEIKEPYLVLTGRIVNLGKIPKDHDIDLFIRAPFKDPSLVRKIIAAVAEKNPEIAKRLHINFDPQAPVIGYGYTLAKLVIKKEEEGRKVSPWEKLAAKVPMFQKPKKAYDIVWDVNELWRAWGVKHIENGIIVQKKYDGMSMWIARDKDRVRIITEDKQRDRAKFFPQCVKELLEISKSDDFGINAEMVWHKDLKSEKQYRREEMIPFIVGEKEVPPDDTVVFHVHDCTWLNGESMLDRPYIERYKALRKIFPEDGKHWKVVPSKFATTKEEFFDAVEWARNLVGSEGAVVKDITGKYSRTGRTPDFAKLKNLKEVDVIIWKVERKKTKEGKPLNQYIYSCAFAAPEEFLREVKPDQVVVVNGKRYINIGKTYSTAEKRKVGDIIAVRPVQVVETDTPEGKIFSWMFPLYAGLALKKEPDDLEYIRKLAAIGTGWSKELEKMSVELLEPCPFYRDLEVCPLVEKFAAPVKLSKSYLMFPIRCELAYYFRCMYCKSYYYYGDYRGTHYGW